MPASIKGTLLLDENHPSLKKAANIINRGGLVAFPTETVYGLGAAATDPEAVNRIYEAKGRPADNPLIVHVSDPAQLKTVARDLPEKAFKLTERFWPGPLSLVLPRAEGLPALVSAGLPSVAVRMPDHRTALELIRLSGVPIAAPSANRSGKPSPTTYRHVLEDLTGRIEAVIKSAPCSVGVESTVLDLTGETPLILRPGGVSREELEETLGCRVAVAGLKSFPGKPLSPGMKYRHYSPRAALILVAGHPEKRFALVKALAYRYRSLGLKVGYLNPSIRDDLKQKVDPERLAATLYELMRRMDQQEIDIILAEEIEITGIGLAVMNRLKKAATRTLRVGSGKLQRKS